MQSRCACISAEQGRQFTCHFTTAFPARHHDPPRIYAVGDSRTPESIIPRASDPYEANQASISDDQDGWLRLTLLRRELQTAIAEEDYELAARLRDQAQVLSQNLPSCKQLLLGLLEKLRSGRARERLTAVQQLGDLGDAAALASLQPVLAEPGDISAAAEASMWSIFMHPPNEQAEECLAHGLKAMSRPNTWPEAEKVFTELIRVAPSFAEGYNKRATVLFLMQRYHASIVDCKAVLMLNEYHFGAASGLGLCLALIGEYEEAIEAFEKAGKLNPRLSAEMNARAATLKAALEEKRRQQGG